MANFPISEIVSRAKSLKIADRNYLMKTVRQKALVCLWKTGLGSCLNASPKLLGTHMVVDFTEAGFKIPLNYTEQDKNILALVAGEDAFRAAEILAANPVVQIWMKDGWFNANAELLPIGESIERLKTSLPHDFYGSIGASLRDASQDQEVRLLWVTKISPCTGSKGPGQFAWIWAGASLFLLLSLLAEKVRRK